MNPKISVVIPMYNAEKYLQTCIESVLNQTFTDFELIIIDDCSTDNSLEIVQKYNDSRIKIYKQLRNSGESSSRNSGLTMSISKYVYFMDQDDAILSTTLEVLFEAIESTQADVVYMNQFYNALDLEFTLSDELNVDIFTGTNTDARILSADLITRLTDEFINCGVVVEPWIKIQRRDFLQANKILFPDTTRAGDNLFNLAELIHGRKMYVIDFCGYIYRSHESNTMNKSAEKSIEESIKSMPPAIKYMSELFSTVDLPSELKYRLESRVIEELFLAFIMRAYDGQLSINEINEIMQRILSQIPTVDLSRVLFNLLAVCKGRI